MKVIARNKKAPHLFFLHETFEAGIALQGTEIKSIRAGKVSIQESHVRIKREQAYIINMHIAPYEHGTHFNHEETRTRKLLLHKQEIRKIDKKITQDSFTVVPLKIYIKDGLCKVEIALAKGKKLFDKRQSLKEKDNKRRLEKQLSPKR